MSVDYTQWADDLMYSYRGISTPFTFWDGLSNSFQAYVNAANAAAKEPVLTLEKAAAKILIKGPILELRIIPDAISRSVFYGFASPVLVGLAGVTNEDGYIGRVVLEQNGFAPRLVCKPRLSIQHGDEVFLDEVPDQWKHGWPLYDILARCLIERVLNADAFIEQVSNNASDNSSR